MNPETTSLFEDVTWILAADGSLDVEREAEWLTSSDVISHVFGLVGEYTSLLLTNQHLEEEPPIVEEAVGCMIINIIIIIISGVSLPRY